MLQEPVFTTNHPPSRLGSIGGPYEIGLQRSRGVGHHGQSRDYGIDILVLKYFGKSSHVVVICSDKLNTEFTFLCGVHLFNLAGQWNAEPGVTNRAAQNNNLVFSLRDEGFDNIAANGTGTTRNCNDNHVDEFARFR